MTYKKDSVLDMIASSTDAFADKFTFYGLNISNAPTVLGQQVGDSYHTIITTDSAISASNTRETVCGGIQRVPGLLKFKLPNFFREAFAVASFATEASVDTRYIRALLDYGEGGASILELSRVASGLFNTRSDHTIVCSYTGLNPTDDTHELYFDFQGYKDQQFFGANILIGVIL